MDCAQHPPLQRHPLLAVVDAVVVQQPERHIVLYKSGTYDVDVAIHLAGIAHALAVYADHLALRAVTHGGGHPLREARPEWPGARF